MFPDTKRLREARITIRLDDYEHRLVTAIAEYNGEQLSTLLRRWAMREAEQVMQELSSNGASVQAHAA